MQETISGPTIPPVIGGGNGDGDGDHNVTVSLSLKSLEVLCRSGRDWPGDMDDLCNELMRKGWKLHDCLYSGGEISIFQQKSRLFGLLTVERRTEFNIVDDPRANVEAYVKYLDKIGKLDQGLSDLLGDNPAQEEKKVQALVCRFLVRATNVRAMNTMASIAGSSRTDAVNRLIQAGAFVDSELSLGAVFQWRQRGSNDPWQDMSFSS